MNPRVELLRKSIGNNIWQESYPILKHINASILSVDEGHVKFEFVVDKKLLNPNKILHGGMMATMLDELMGCAAWTMNKETTFATINLQVDFLTAAKEDEVLLGDGIVIKAGNSIIHAEAKLFNANNRMIAKASSNLVAMPTKKEGNPLQIA
jgi:acyl-coenzyme A thioesterase 13